MALSPVAKIIYRLTIALMIAGSVQTAAKEKISLLAPYDEWYFNFFYPNSLPAPVPPLLMALSPSLLTMALSPSIRIPMESGSVTVIPPLLWRYRRHC
ncbi:hypothetical protein C7H11_25940 [Escherichia coli]|nr:hypothetical protein C7H11_25940 [Escherichia coli]